MTIKMEDRRFIIGIDLGTTNCAVSFLDTEADGLDAKRIRSFAVPQMVAPGEVSTAPVLPSFLYIPGEFDISREAIRRLWDNGDSHFAGIFARDHGSRVPDRLVSSAKSWLCHSAVDRRARILPWGSSGEIKKISPVTATAAYLKHIRMAWNQFQGEDEALHLENQLVIITVPASFDEVARELTLEAAKQAGIGDLILLEEPLAAFYSWLMRHEKTWREFLEPGELILVCDVGGGTTDFTLIVLTEHKDSPRFERIAVGDHLILGGDNIDLTLARLVETRMAGSRRSMSTQRWKELCHQCRQAKESLLNGDTQNVNLTVVGQGSKLIANTLTAVLGREEVAEKVLEGFFPVVGTTDQETPGSRKGITEFGLPYEQEPAITRHLLWFLNQHAEDVRRSINRDIPVPDLILFNGGSLKPEIIQHRIQTAIQHGFEEAHAPKLRVLENPNLDTAVALGAVYYGLVKIGEGVKVGSGSPRAYYLGVTRSGSQPQRASIQEAVCVVERGLEEGNSISLAERSFEVLTNRPVSFDLYSSSYRSGDRHGDVVAIDGSLTSLPPLQTVVLYGKKGLQKTLPVQIEAEYTEIGTFALKCRSQVSDHRWNLQFHLRSDVQNSDVADSQILDASIVSAAQKHMRRVLTGNNKQGVEKLVAGITQRVALPRDDWPLGMIRTLADDLLKLDSVRNVSPVHESGWMNLLGFCLRPGIGESFDKQRIGRVWKLYMSGLKHPKHPRVRLEWWILWRRVAAGLTPGQQRQFFQNISTVLYAKKTSSPRIPVQERLEIWMALANMEKLDPKEKAALGGHLIDEVSPRKIKAQHLWALSRLGARELLYGSVDRVIAPAEVAPWIERLLGYDRSNPITIARAVSRMARKTNDRIRDLDEKMRTRVLTWMQEYELPSDLIDPIRKTMPLARQDQKAMFGESLPSGIILKE
jgi:molecular chaperone DnaK (HSP70)